MCTFCHKLEFACIHFGTLFCIYRMGQEIIDLEEIIRKWVSDFPLDKSQKKEADDILSSDINWRHMRVRHGSTEYYDQIRVNTPKTHVLFTAHFSNETDLNQVYSLKTERRTKSICTISIQKTFTYGYNLDLKLTPPNPIIEANAGFKGELGLTKSGDETFEEELVWSVDNQITVPPKFKTIADLVIKEDEYASHFKTESKFEGKVHVTLRNKKDNTPLATITGDVKQIFTPDKGFRVDKTGVYFVTIGKCKCRFGIEQHVHLSQSELTETREIDP
ncbi:uncharacterized protein LOC111111269 isoform X1 [Crassostrea virginica]|uniref:Uncharacterized protein LOC111111269 isoform X1 n=2 Tax=Crassostrea virginica TaxID=6565 RepID=A0A8B8BLY0_CRAVI|nr:uncharacterized protein LOC111111269 isoform X1 [Crassostrea virginica]